MKRARWIREAALVVVVYLAYSLVRSSLGGSGALAEENAHRIVSLERRLGLFHERSIQQLLDSPAVIRPLNTFYALAHFSVTVGVLLWLFVTRSDYPLRRNALMFTTLLALVGYALFPLMPPRLLPGDGIIDSLAVHGAPWTYSGKAVASISNQYAAMPSLHVGWAMWCGWAVWREVRSRWIRVVAVAYPALAMVAVVATGNHFILDIAGAAIVLAAGIGLADWNRRRITPSAVVGAEPHEPAAHASPASVRAPERTARRGSHIARTDDLPDHASFAGG